MEMHKSNKLHLLQLLLLLFLASFLLMCGQGIVVDFTETNEAFLHESEFNRTIDSNIVSQWIEKYGGDTPPSQDSEPKPDLEDSTQPADSTLDSVIIPDNNDPDDNPPHEDVDKSSSSGTQGEDTTPEQSSSSSMIIIPTPGSSAQGSSSPSPTSSANYSAPGGNSSPGPRLSSSSQFVIINRSSSSVVQIIPPSSSVAPVVPSSSSVALPVSSSSVTQVMPSSSSVAPIIPSSSSVAQVPDPDPISSSSESEDPDPDPEADPKAPVVCPKGTECPEFSMTYGGGNQVFESPGIYKLNFAEIRGQIICGASSTAPTARDIGKLTNGSTTSEISVPGYNSQAAWGKISANTAYVQIYEGFSNSFCMQDW